MFAVYHWVSSSGCVFITALSSWKTALFVVVEDFLCLLNFYYFYSVWVKAYLAIFLLLFVNRCSHLCSPFIFIFTAYLLHPFALSLECSLRWTEQRTLYSLVCVTHACQSSHGEAREQLAGGSSLLQRVVLRTETVVRLAWCRCLHLLSQSQLIIDL